MKRIPAAVALLATIALPASTATAAPPVQQETSPIPAFTRAAHPLISTEPSENTWDLRVLTRMVGTQGAFLREQLGKDCATVGFSFDSGSFNANDTEDPQGRLRTFTIPSAPVGNNEYTLDRVPYRDYVVDLRTLPRATKDWLNVARPTRDIGTAYPWPDLPVNLAKSYDVLIHLHRVTAANLHRVTAAKLR